MSAHPNTAATSAPPPPNVQDAIDALRNLLASPVEDAAAMFRLGAAAVFRTVAKTDPHWHRVIDAIDSIGEQAELYPVDYRQELIADGIEDAKKAAPKIAKAEPAARPATLPIATPDEQPEPTPDLAAPIITPADLENYFADWQEIVATAGNKPAMWRNCIVATRARVMASEIGRSAAIAQLAVIADNLDLPAADLDRVSNGHAPDRDAYLPATIDDTSAIVPAKFITPAAWPDEAPPPVDWLVPGFIQRGDVTTLHGDGGAGKTDIALRLAANVARGAAEWLGLEVAPTANGPVVFISAEDPERKVRRRLWHHAKHDGYDLNSVTDLHLWFPAKMSGTLLAVPDRHTGTMKPTAAFQSLAAAIVELRPGLVVTDNVAATYGGNQNDRAQVRSFVNLWADIAEGPSRPAVLLLDHPSLSGLTNGTGRGGNMDWRNAVRSALHLYAPTDKADADRGVRILETTKINEGKPGNPVRLIWAEGGLQLEHAQPSHHRAAKEQQCDEMFLRLLDERIAQGSHIGRKMSGMYAPKVFADMPDNGGFNKHAFAASMERQFKAGILREVFDPKRRHDYIDRAASA